MLGGRGTRIWLTAITLVSWAMCPSTQHACSRYRFRSRRFSFTNVNPLYAKNNLPATAQTTKAMKEKTTAVFIAEAFGFLC